MRPSSCLSWSSLLVLLLSLTACESPPTNARPDGSLDGAAIGAILGQLMGGTAGLSGSAIGAIGGSGAAAPSKSKDGLTLVCVAAPGNCYAQRPIKIGAQCECASSEGIAAGRGLNAGAGQTVSLSSVVRIYFATDRERLAASGAVQDFGAGRSADCLRSGFPWRADLLQLAIQRQPNTACLYGR
jgi:hypothetical protein